jgi:hypothetical protein
MKLHLAGVRVLVVSSATIPLGQKFFWHAIELIAATTRRSRLPFSNWRATKRATTSCHRDGSTP